MYRNHRKQCDFAPSSKSLVFSDIIDLSNFSGVGKNPIFIMNRLIKNLKDASEKLNRGENGEMEKKTNVPGIVLFALAAFFAVSLLCGKLGGGLFWKFGQMISHAYGLCSILIPIFFFAAGIQMIGEQWKLKNAVLLALSIFPFFTLVLAEKIIRACASSSSGGVLAFEITGVIALCAVIILGEYAFISAFGDFFQERFAPGWYNGKKSEETEHSEDTISFSEDSEKSEEEEIPEGQLSFLDGISSNEIYEDEAVEKNPVFLPKDEISEEKERTNAFFAKMNFDEMEKNAENPFSNSFEKNENDSDSVEKIEEIEKTEEIPDDYVFPKDEDDEEDDFSLNSFEEKAESVEADESSEISAYEEGAGEENPKPFPPKPFLEKEEKIDVAPAESEISGQTLLRSKEQEQDISDNIKAAVASAHFSSEEIDYPIFSKTADDEREREIEPQIEQNDEDETDGGGILFRPESPVEARALAASAAAREFYKKNEPLHFSNKEESVREKNAPSPIPPSAWIPELPREVRTDTLNVRDVFSSMDSDAAKNPVLSAEVRADFENDALLQNQKIESETAKNPILDDALPEKSDSEKSENLEKSEQNFELDSKSEEFDPTARPVVDSNGQKIDYEDDSEETDDEDEIEDENDEDFVDDESDEIEDDSEDEDEEIEEESHREEIAPAPFVAPPKNALPESKRFRKGPYEIPVDLLDEYPGNAYWEIDEDTQHAGNELTATLKEFKIDTEITGIRKGPTVTMYELLPAPGVKLSKIVNLQDNIALRLAAASVRIVAPIPGKHAVGIEVPNKNRAIVSFREIVEKELSAFEKMAIPVILGKDISGEPQLLDLAKTPHLLIAGSTGAGKSVCVNSMLLSILYKRSPEQVKLVLVDPKVVELKLYNDIPHLLTPVITEPKRALQSLQYCLCEMERRYALLDGMGVRNIISYNKKIAEKRIATEKLPYIVVIIDEFADLMATTGKELEQTIARLAAMSRAVGIHLVLATQRPSVDVITGLIKANIPSRIAFMVASKMDSRIIIDQLGADKLLGKGDMLYVGSTDPFPSRIQGTLVGDDEVERVVEYVKTFGEPEYIDEEMFVDDEDDEGGSGGDDFGDGADPLYDQALQIVIQSGKASASYIQRKLKIGYNRAARLVEEMETRGIVGPANGSKPREIIHMP